MVASLYWAVLSEVNTNVPENYMASAGSLPLEPLSRKVLALDLLMTPLCTYRTSPSMCLKLSTTVPGALTSGTPKSPHSLGCTLRVACSTGCAALLGVCWLEPLHR